MTVHIDPTIQRIIAVILILVIFTFLAYKYLIKKSDHRVNMNTAITCQEIKNGEKRIS